MPKYAPLGSLRPRAVHRAHDSRLALTALPVLTHKIGHTTHKINIIQGSTPFCTPSQERSSRPPHGRLLEIWMFVCARRQSDAPPLFFDTLLLFDAANLSCNNTKALHDLLPCSMKMCAVRTQGSGHVALPMWSCHIVLQVFSRQVGLACRANQSILMRSKNWYN